MQKFLTAKKFETAPAMNARKSVSDVMVMPTPLVRNVSPIRSSTVSRSCAPDSPDRRINISSIPIPTVFEKKIIMIKGKNKHVLGRKS